MLNELDWDAAEVILAFHRTTRPWVDLIPYRMPSGWLLVSPDYREEVLCDLATLGEAERLIEACEIGMAERHADPYPDRIWPECERN